MHFSINCSTVICSPTVILMLSWEKPLVKPMAPGSIFHHISFRSTILQSFTFLSINQKYQKYFLSRLSISIRSHFCKWPWRDWQPIYRVGCKLFDYLCRYDLCVVSYWIDKLVLKLREILISTLLHHPFLFKGKTNASSRSISIISRCVPEHE